MSVQNSFVKYGDSRTSSEIIVLLIPDKDIIRTYVHIFFLFFQCLL